MSGSNVEPAKTLVMPEASEAPAAASPSSTLIVDEDTNPPVSFRRLYSLGATASLPNAEQPEAPKASVFANRYEPRSLLGEGGMGEVRLARDKVVGREVAVKTMLPEVQAFARERFLREARVQGQLEHPSIVPIYDLGVTEEQQLFFTMKRLRGASLERILDDLTRGDAGAAGRYPQRRLLGAFVQVALAVEFAHSRGVIHRDLKPANVMLGDFGEVYVLDWGLARVQFGPNESGPLPAISRSDAAKATVAGSVLGTPGYMAPEQAAGSLEALDRRADVYALGAILYEIVSGERLHGQETLESLLAATLTGPIPPLRERPSTARIPEELLELITRATALLPSRRLATARELADAVEKFLDGERDESRRRELAQEHVVTATTLASRDGAAVEALREVGRALALDPANAAALQLLHRLLSAPPDEIPPSAEAELDAADQERRRGILRVARFRAVAWLIAAPFFIALGVTNVLRMAAVVGLVASNVALATFLVRLPRVSNAVLRLSLSFSTLCLASFTMFYGPLLLVPLYAVTNAITYAMGGSAALRRDAVVLSVAAIILPLVATLAGVDASYYMAHGVDGFVVWSPMLKVPLGPTMAILCAAYLATVIAPTLLIGRFSEQVSRAERQVILQAHRLRQLLPPD